MPHLERSEKQALERGTIEPTTPGQLNYCFTMLALEYMERVGERYQTHNDILGAFEGAKAEWYRIKTAPYENKKIRENGNAYEREI